MNPFFCFLTATTPAFPKGWAGAVVCVGTYCKAVENFINMISFFPVSILHFRSLCGNLRLPHKLHSANNPTGNVFLPIGKNALSTFAFSVGLDNNKYHEYQEFVWQQTETGVFRCAVPFGAAHFFISQSAAAGIIGMGGAWEMKKQMQRGACCE